MKTKILQRPLTSFVACATVLLAPQIAHAQTAGAPRSAETPDSSEEIIVTAQKRSERLQDVPISISVVEGADLVRSGAAQLTDFAGYVPGLQVDNSGAPGRSSTTIRGIAPIGTSSTVGVILDGAPMGLSSNNVRSQEYSLDLLPYDLAQVEVLRGPQGTLYGASSLGGLLKYTTIAPNLREFSARAGGEVFSLAHASDLGFAGQGFVNAPLVTDVLAMTASYAYRATPGWIDNIQTGAEDQNDYTQEGGRLSLLWQASEDVSIRLSGLFQTIDASDDAIIAQGPDGVSVGNGRSNYNYIDEPSSSRLQYYSTAVDYDAGFATLSSLTTFSNSETSRTRDATLVFGLAGAVPPVLAPYLITLDSDKFTEELRLTSPSSDRFEWLLGAFYTEEDTENHQLVNAVDLALNPIPGFDPIAVVSVPNHYEEVAVFGNATLKFGERFHLTAGLRWSHHEQNFHEFGNVVGVPVDEVGNSSEEVVTYSISPQFHVNEDTMLYARVATGYRPGGPNAAIFGVPPSVDSDTVTNYEVGLKSDLFHRILSLQVALFDIEWEDIQVGVDFGGVGGTANGPSARSRGVEGELLWRPIDGLTLGLNGAYTNAELTGDAIAAIGGGDGDRLPYIPEWSGSLTSDYSWDVASNVMGEVGGGIRYVGDRVSDFPAAAQPLGPVPIDAYTAVDLHAGLTFNDTWTLRAYARNLTNEIGPISRAVQGTQTGGNVVTLTPLQPRTIGVSLDVAF